MFVKFLQLQTSKAPFIIYIFIGAIAVNSKIQLQSFQVFCLVVRNVSSPICMMRLFFVIPYQNSRMLFVKLTSHLENKW